MTVAKTYEDHIASERAEAKLKNIVAADQAVKKIENAFEILEKVMLEGINEEEAGSIIAGFETIAELLKPDQKTIAMTVADKLEEIKSKLFAIDDQYLTKRVIEAQQKLDKSANPDDWQAEEGQPVEECNINELSQAAKYFRASLLDIQKARLSAVNSCS